MTEPREDIADESKSRERFEKWATENKLVGLMIGLEFADGNYVAEQLAKRWPTWRAAERDTRERCGQHKAKLSAIVKWLEANQPDVFKRGLWDALAQAEAIRKGGE